MRLCRSRVESEQRRDEVENLAVRELIAKRPTGVAGYGARTSVSGATATGLRNSASAYRVARCSASSTI